MSDGDLHLHLWCFAGLLLEGGIKGFALGLLRRSRLRLGLEPLGDCLGLGSFLWLLIFVAQGTRTFSGSSAMGFSLIFRSFLSYCLETAITR